MTQPAERNSWDCLCSDTAPRRQYNGLPNRATWLVGVWDFFDLDHVRQAIDNILSGDAGTNSEINPYIVDTSGLERAVTVALADWLKHDHTRTLYGRGIGATVVGFGNLDGYLQAHIDMSIGAICWLEIAEHYEEEIKEAIAGYAREEKQND